MNRFPASKQELKRTYGFDVNFERAKDHLEENDGAGNTFKATAKPVLIGTAVVGATTMIFSIVVALTHGLRPDLLPNLSILHPPFLLGLIAGGSIIYWFTGASTQAVTTGAYRAVEFIKANIRLEGVTKASVTDSKKVVEICTQYAQRGMFNIFLTVFFVTLGFCLRRAVLFHWLSDLDRAFRSVSSHFHGECRRRLGQRQEDCRDGIEAERHGTARCHGRRRHGGRSVQRYFVGGFEPDHQIHDAVRICWPWNLPCHWRMKAERCSDMCLQWCFC